LVRAGIDAGEFSGGSTIFPSNGNDIVGSDTIGISINSELAVSKINISNGGISESRSSSQISNSDVVNTVQVDGVSSRGLLARGDLHGDVLRSWAVNNVDLVDARNGSSNNLADNNTRGLEDGVRRSKDGSPNRVLDGQSSASTNEVDNNGTRVSREVVTSKSNIASSNNVQDPFSLSVTVGGPIVSNRSQVRGLDVNSVSFIVWRVASNQQTTIQNRGLGIGCSVSQCV